MRGCKPHLEKSRYMCGLVKCQIRDISITDLLPVRGDGARGSSCIIATITRTISKYFLSDTCLQ